METSKKLGQNHIDKHTTLSNVGKIFAVNASNMVVNVMIKATNEVIYKKRQLRKRDLLYSYA